MIRLSAIGAKHVQPSPFFVGEAWSLSLLKTLDLTTEALLPITV